jgi:hypothetical protein
LARFWHGPDCAIRAEDREIFNLLICWVASHAAGAARFRVHFVTHPLQQANVAHHHVHGAREIDEAFVIAFFVDEGPNSFDRLQNRQTPFRKRFDKLFPALWVFNGGRLVMLSNISGVLTVTSFILLARSARV